jgi:hypothetical protein
MLIVQHAKKKPDSSCVDDGSLPSAAVQLEFADASSSLSQVKGSMFEGFVILMQQVAAAQSDASNPHSPSSAQSPRSELGRR